MKYRCHECSFKTNDEEEYDDHVNRHMCEHETVTSWGESIFCTDCGKNL